MGKRGQSHRENFNYNFWSFTWQKMGILNVYIIIFVKVDHYKVQSIE